MKENFKFVALCLLVIAAAGCGVGDAPKGLTAEETQKAVKALPIDQQIDYINRSPLPQAEKAKRIAELKAKSGAK